MLKTQNHRARKRFGQNFLHDQVIIDRIVSVIVPQQQDLLVEIGPGLGALTTPLLKQIGNLHAIEIDRDLIAELNQKFSEQNNFFLHDSDALKFDFGALMDASSFQVQTNTQQHCTKLRIVGNLPYNISTPMIFHLLTFSSLIKDMHFMLQKEVVERLSAEPGCKQFGRLSVMVQYHCEVEHLFDVFPESFQPRPKVDSAIVRLKPKRQSLKLANDESVLAKTVTTAFSQRRKTLANTLKPLLGKVALEQSPVNLQLRAENLSVSDFVNLSNYVGKHQ